MVSQSLSTFEKNIHTRFDVLVVDVYAIKFEFRCVVLTLYLPLVVKSNMTT